MGEFIVAPGEKALTSLGDSNPAPSDYSPKVDLTQQSTAHYSMARRYTTQKSAYNVGPADYNTLCDIGKGHRMTLKEKGKMMAFGIREDQMNGSVGPAGYNVTYKDTGTTGPRLSMSRRHSEGINTGPPNSLVQPVDTIGKH
ncbi:uncharacterized protein LOC135490941 [Lineus longissimus]|uniref:uncharacterized protein LOC135490941 n=1 Tax=Lineus longissimus TaxID=88925 RepID=UPI00315CF66B